MFGIKRVTKKNTGRDKFIQLTHLNKYLLCVEINLNRIFTFHYLQTTCNP